MNSVRGDDDVLALLDEMGGGIIGGASSVPSKSHRNDAPDERAASSSSSSSFWGVDPLVEVARRRCHEGFKAGFYDLFRSCCASSPASTMTTTTTSTERVARDVVRSTLASTWSSIPPHAVWERFQFSLKALEADRAREAGVASIGTTGDDAGRRPAVVLRAMTARDALALIARGSTVWEPLLPSSSIVEMGGKEDDDDDDGTRRAINGRYREGTLALLRGEVEFQFRRTFRGRRGRGPKEIRELRASMEDGGGNATSGGWAKKGKKKMEEGILMTTATHDDDDDEEFVLRTIFESRHFQNITQKLHKKFHILAGEWHSAFVSELRKLSNRSIVEEQRGRDVGSGGGGGGGGRRRKRGRNGGPDRGVPRISLAGNRDRDYHDDDDDYLDGGSIKGGGRDDRPLAVSFAGISLRINGSHEAKLRSLYRRALRDRRAGGGERDDGDDDELSRREYPRLLFSLLLRYDALEGAGLQSAVPRAVFRYLRTRFGRGVFECFASPFNCHCSEGGGSSDDDDHDDDHDYRLGGGVAAAMGGRYGSAFADTDAPFGSAGSFFDLDFANGGCYQANPPFASEFIERMCHRMHSFLCSRGEIPLMFVVFVPAWSESAGYKMLETSPYVTRHVLLSQRDDVHYYTEGTQHRRRSANGDVGGHRIASFDTSVFFLQNDAARERWPLRDEDGSMLKDAFAMNPVNGRGFRGAKDDDVNGERTLPGRKVEISSAVSRPKSGNGNSASSSATRGRETKGTTPKRKSNGSLSKKKKLVAGGQDELSILASMGMLDR